MEECRGRRVIFRAYEKELPNGRKVLVDEVLFPDSVAILPVYTTGERPRIVLVRQYRPALDQWTFEAPAGVIDKGETPEDAAKRELKEEAGLDASIIEKVGEGYTTPGYSREYMTLYIAWNPKKSSMDPEGYEVIEGIVEMDLESALESVRSGSIRDIKTILLIYAAALKLRGNGAD